MPNCFIHLYNIDLKDEWFRIGRSERIVAAAVSWGLWALTSIIVVVVIVGGRR